MLRSAFACLPLQRKQLGINVMHERLALDEVMIHDIKLSSLLSYVSAGSQPNNFPCRTSSWIKVHVVINNFDQQNSLQCVCLNLSTHMIKQPTRSCGLANREVTPAKILLLSIIIFRVEHAGSASAAHTASRRLVRRCCFRFKPAPLATHQHPALRTSLWD